MYGSPTFQKGHILALTGQPVLDDRLHHSPTVLAGRAFLPRTLVERQTLVPDDPGRKAGAGPHVLAHIWVSARAGQLILHLRFPPSKSWTHINAKLSGIIKFSCYEEK